MDKNSETAMMGFVSRFRAKALEPKVETIRGLWIHQPPKIRILGLPYDS